MANLTDAELAAVRDALQAENRLIEKYKSFAEVTDDPTVRGLCEQIAAQHKTHYDTIFGVLS